MKYTGAMKRCGALVLALVLALGLLSGCGKAQDRLSITAALTGAVSTLDPAMVTTDAERTVVYHLYDNLMKLSYDSEGNMTAVNGVAERYQCRSNEDGTETYTFTLRSDALWSDGKTVTADDFVYAWRHLVDPDTASPNASILNMVSGYSKAQKGKTKALAVKARDDNTLEVVLAHPCPYFLSAVCTSPATMPVRQDDVKLTDGAYWLGQQEESALTLTAAGKYYDSKRRGPDEVQITLCADAADTAKLYGSGKCDVALGLLQGVDDTAVTVGYPEVGTLLVNQMAERMDSKSLRSAMSLVIDRQAVAEEMGGTAAEGLVPPGVKNTQGADFRTDGGAIIDTVQDDYEKNCQTAKELLKKAGYDSAALQKLNIHLLCEDTTRWRNVGVLLKDTWFRQLGITVTLEKLSAEKLSAALHKGEFTMALTTVRSDRQDAAGYLDTWRSGSSGNRANFHSGAYDMVLQIADASQSDEARDGCLKDAENLLLDKGYVMPLYTTSRVRQVRGNLAGLLDDGLGAYYLGFMHKGV